MCVFIPKIIIYKEMRVEETKLSIFGYVYQNWPCYQRGSIATLLASSFL